MPRKEMFTDADLWKAVREYAGEHGNTLSDRADWRRWISADLSRPPESLVVRRLGSFESVAHAIGAKYVESGPEVANAPIPSEPSWLLKPQSVAAKTKGGWQTMPSKVNGASGWEMFRLVTPQVEVRRGGRLVLNDVALRALGNPMHVTLWWHADRRAVGIKSGDGADALPLAEIRGKQAVDAKAFLAWAGLDLACGKCEVKLEDGMLVFGVEGLARAGEGGTEDVRQELEEAEPEVVAP